MARKDDLGISDNLKNKKKIATNKKHINVIDKNKSSDSNKNANKNSKKINTGDGNAGGNGSRAPFEERKGGRSGRDGQKIKEAFSLTLSCNDPQVKTADLLKQKINPSAANIKFIAFKQINDSKVVVVCSDDASRIKLKTKIENKIPILETKEPLKPNPYIATPGIKTGVSCGEVEAAVNDITGKNPIHVSYSSKKKTFYVELSPTQHKTCLQEKKIILGWEVLRIYDHISVKRCYKCHRLGHTAQKCRTSEIELLQIKKITEEKKCSNCLLYHNDKEGKNHVVWDRSCPHYKKILGSIKKNTKMHPDE